jgi:HEAT repeat protein
MILAALVATTGTVAVAQDADFFLPYDRERGELSPGTQAPSVENMLSTIRTGTPGALIATLEYGERVECGACVGPLQRNLLESDNSEVRRISAWWLRRRIFASGPIVRSLRATLADDGDPVRRARAAEALGEFLDPHSLAPLSDAALGDTVPFVRATAVRALGRLNHPGGNEVIGDALSDVDVEVRRSAIGVVLRVNFFREYDAILDALDDSDPEVQRRAATLVGELGIATGVEPLSALLVGSPDRDVRQAAAWSLGRLGGAAARAALTSAQQSETDSLVLDAVAIALRM